MDLSLITSILSGSFGIVAGWLLCQKFGFKCVKPVKIKPLSGKMKLVLVVRKDLKMGNGKIAAQCCHATLGCYQQAKISNPGVLKTWENQGQPKVVLKVETYDDMVELSSIAESVGITNCIIHDAGHTQIPVGSATVVGIGPAPTSELDKITGNLKLL